MNKLSALIASIVISLGCGGEGPDTPDLIEESGVAVGAFTVDSDSTTRAVMLLREQLDAIGGGSQVSIVFEEGERGSPISVDFKGGPLGALVREVDFSDSEYVWRLSGDVLFVYPQIDSILKDPNIPKVSLKDVYLLAGLQTIADQISELRGDTLVVFGADSLGPDAGLYLSQRISLELTDVSLSVVLASVSAQVEHTFDLLMTRSEVVAGSTLVNAQMHFRESRLSMFRE